MTLWREQDDLKQTMKKSSLNILSALILAFFLFSLYSADAVGRKTREQKNDGGVYMLRNSVDAYYFWKKQGYRGKVAFCFSRFLHFLPIQYPEPGFAGYPLLLPDFEREYESRLSYRNMLWAAVQLNAVRYVYNIVPRPDFEDRKTKIVSSEDRYSIVRPDEIIRYDEGILRTISYRIPRMDEPVLVYVDASYSANEDVEKVLEWISGRRNKADMIILCLAVDNPDVTDEERQRLSGVASSYQARLLTFQ